MKVALIILMLCSSLCTYTQQYPVTSQIETQWRTLEVTEPVSYTFGGNNSAISFRGSILYIGDNEALVSGFNNKKGYGMFRINKEGVSKWEVTVPGLIIGFGKWKGQIIAFYTAEWQDRNSTFNFIRQVHAILIDMETGDKLGDQVVFKNTDKAYVDVRTLTRPDGEFQQLLIRVSGFDKTPFWSANGINKMRSDTKSLNILTFGDDLSPISTAVSLEAVSGIFVGSMVNAEGATFMAVMDKGKLILKKFNKELEVTDKLETDLIVELQDISSINMVLGTVNSNSVLMSMKYADKEYIVAFYNFDFVSNKVFFANQVMDKNWAKQLKQESKNEVNMQSDGLEKRKHLVTVGTAQIPDKIIFIYQEKYRVGRVEDYFTRNDGILIMIYDRQLKLLRNVLIDKENINHSSVDMFLSVGYHVQGNKLLVIANSGIDDKKVLLTTVDLSTLHKEQFELRNRLSRLECGATLWFDDRFLVDEVAGAQCYYYTINYQ
jgi:hypothetical protein